MAEVSAHLSRIFAGSRPIALADGVTGIPVKVKLRDVNNEPAVGYAVTLRADDLDVTFDQPGVTDDEGRTTGMVYSANVGTATIRATVDEVE